MVGSLCPSVLVLGLWVDGSEVSGVNRPTPGGGSTSLATPCRNRDSHGLRERYLMFAGETPKHVTAAIG